MKINCEIDLDVDFGHELFVQTIGGLVKEEIERFLRDSVRRELKSREQEVRALAKRLSKETIVELQREFERKEAKGR